MRRSRRMLVGAATAAGLALGWAAARVHRRRHRHDLFSRRPLRRLAALGALEGRATPDTLRTLHDYLRWEPVPLLRRKARGLVHRLEASLG